MLYIKEEDTSISLSTDVVTTVFDGLNDRPINLVKLD